MGMLGVVVYEQEDAAPVGRKVLVHELQAPITTFVGGWFRKPLPPGKPGLAAPVHSAA
jgi:hypothetical protein